MSTEAAPTIVSLIDSQPDWFEGSVLAAACRSREFYNQFHTVLCVAEQPGETQNDFSYPSDNLIYRIIGQFRQITAGMPGMDVVPESFFQVTLQAYLQLGDVQPDQIEPTLQRVKFLMNCPLEQMIPVISQGVGHWISKTRVRKVVARSMAEPSWSPVEFVRSLAVAESAGRQASAPAYAHLFGDGRKAGKLHVDRLPSGINRLDRAMGGGFGVKEMTLIIGSTGAGKTVLASQLASTFAQSGFPGIWISTEETHDQLEPRIYSNACQIPYNQIKDGIDLNKLSKDKADMALALEAKIGTNMLILDWVTDRSKTIDTDLSEEIRKFKERFKTPPRWLMFDWLGGAQGTLTTAQMAVQRQLLQQTADGLADQAVAHNMVVIALAQGNITLCRNNMKIDSSCLMDNKTLGRKATTILGISQLQEQTDAMAGGEPPYLRKQFLFASKTRRGVGGLIPIIRNFEFQRYENLDHAERK
jgi:hypothetical protein